ncbi:MAG: serine/threonine kinase family protein [Myxococcales bacterium]|nr:serine/threonine kinase family protein [Myxococcales bacterium]
MWIAGRPPIDADRDRDHLAICHACRAVIAFARTSTLTVTAAADGSGPTPVPTLKRGETVGRYVIVSTLGAGGMGVVYAAYDPELDRKVALKLLRPGPGDAVGSHGFRDRLRREAQAMARLRHPNVIKVYDVSTKPGELFVAMELVDGVTLGEWLRERVRSWRELVDVFRKAGEGLSAAHDAGLVHRDFKPDNVLISRGGDVFVTDFGLARALGHPEPMLGALGDGPLSDGTQPSPGAGWSTPLTVTGALVGTPIYMAPEQMTGTAVDARSDLYSFCTALYEALFGRRPYAARTIEELRKQVAGGLLREPERGGAHCPTWLKRTVMQGLSVDPAERQPSMRVLLDEMAQDPGARWRRIAAVVGAAFLVLSLALVQREVTRRQLKVCHGGESKLAGAWDGSRRGEVERMFAASGRPTAAAAFRNVTSALDEWSRDWLRAHEDTCAATRLRGEQSAEMLDLRMACLDRSLAEARALVDVLGHADGAVVDRAAAAARSLEPASSCAADTLLRAGDKLPATAEARARAGAIEAQVAKAKAQEYAGRYKDGAPVAAAAVAAAAQAHFGGIESDARYWNGVLQYHLGHLKESEVEVQRAATLATSLGRDDVAARSYAFLGFLMGSQQRHFDSAHLALDVARASAQHLGERPDLESFRLRQEASVLTNEGRHGEAIEVYQRALKVQRKVTTRPTLKEAELNLGLARAYTEADRQEEALVAIRRGCAIYETMFGPDYPMIGEAQLQLGFILRQLGRGDEAVAAMERALAARQATHGPDHPSVIEALVLLGDTLSWGGKPAEGVVFLERAIADGERIKTPYPDVAAALIDLGWAHLKLGKRDRAHADFARALAHPKAGELSFEIGEAKFGQAELAWDAGDHTRAAALALEARALLDKSGSDLRDDLARWLETHKR